MNTRMFSSQWFLSIWALGVMALVWLSGMPASADQRHSETYRILYWDQGKLRIKGTSPSAAFAGVVNLVNQGRFDEAMGATEAITGNRGAFQRGAIYLAIAGHLDYEADFLPLIERAQQELQHALKQDPENKTILRLLHGIRLYQQDKWGGFASGKWVPFIEAVMAYNKGQQQAPADFAQSESNPMLIGGRALALAPYTTSDTQSKLLDLALQHLKQVPNDGNKTRVYAVTGWPGRFFHFDNHELARNLIAIIELSQAHDWADSVPRPGDLLWTRRMQRLVRINYWWWMQIRRPQTKYFLDLIMKDVTASLSKMTFVRLYAGEKVPWGEELLPKNAPPNAPGWAVAIRELRGRMDRIMRWWFLVKQAPDGQLGGGWEDDCETMRNWPIAAIVVNNDIVADGNRRLANGIWNSGEVVNGWDRRMKDVEHSSEMVNDSAPVMAQLDYGDPLWIERCMRTAKTVDELFMAVNDHGHYHFKGMKMSATEITTGGRSGVDACYCGRGMRSTVMAAWYSNHPRLVQNVERWALAWSEDTLRAGKTKPAGIVPTVIAFTDDNVDGRGPSWYDSGLGGLYQWLVQVDEIWATQLAAYRITGNDKVIEGLRKQIEVVLDHTFDTQADAKGSLDWAVKTLRNHGEFRRVLQWYRNYTGDKRLDDAIIQYIKPGYEAYRITGNLANVEGRLMAGLEHLRYNLPMRTTEVQGTDRVGLDFYSIMGPFSGGIAAIYGYPSMAVTWRQVNNDFTAMVRDFGDDFIKAWVYQFGARAAKPVLHFWQLPPGRYELRLARDENADTKPDRGTLITRKFKIQERFDKVSFPLPAQELWTVEVRQLEAFDFPPPHRPDLAVMQRDIKLDAQPQVGQTIHGSVTIHNIGSEEATGIQLRLSVIRDQIYSHPILDEPVEDLPYSADLLPKTHSVSFQWKPPDRGTYSLVAAVFCKNTGGEICSTNNKAIKKIVVR